MVYALNPRGSVFPSGPTTSYITPKATRRLGQTSFTVTSSWMIRPWAPSGTPDMLPERSNTNTISVGFSVMSGGRRQCQRHLKFAVTAHFAAVHHFI